MSDTIQFERKPALEITSRQISIRIAGQRTTVRLFEGEIEALGRICDATNVTIDDFCTSVATDARRLEHSLTAKLRGAIVSFLLDKWRTN